MANKRRNKYETHVLPRMIEIKGWVKNGMIDKEVAKKLGIGYTTFREYVKKYPELSTAMYESKTVADFAVFNALFDKAIGHYVPVEEVYKIKESHYDENGKKVEVEKIEVVVVHKYIPPEFTAQAFWLKNRLPESWRDKFDNNISGELGVVQINDEVIEKLLGVNNETA